MEFHGSRLNKNPARLALSGSGLGEWKSSSPTGCGGSGWKVPNHMTPLGASQKQKLRSLRTSAPVTWSSSQSCASGKQVSRLVGLALACRSWIGWCLIDAFRVKPHWFVELCSCHEIHFSKIGVWTDLGWFFLA